MIEVRGRFVINKYYAKDVFKMDSKSSVFLSMSFPKMRVEERKSGQTCLFKLQQPS